LHDRITTLATGINGGVRRISTVYDVVGNVRSVTSWNNATVGQGTVLNQGSVEKGGLRAMFVSWLTRPREMPTLCRKFRQGIIHRTDKAA